VKAKGWGSCYRTGDQGGWEFAATSKKLALQVSWGSLLSSARGLIKMLVHCVNIKYLYVVSIQTRLFVCRLNINHAWSTPASCI
jgi:hypothetical protein